MMNIDNFCRDFLLLFLLLLIVLEKNVLDFKSMPAAFLLEYSGAAYYHYLCSSTEILRALWI